MYSRGTVIDLDDIRLFVKVAELKSFVRAASDLRIQNSLLSRRIARLEATLGVRLLQRTTRKVSLTEEGALFLSETSRGLGQLNAAVDSLNSLHGAARGTIRVSSPIEVGQYLVAHLLPGFLAAYPEIRVEWDMISFEKSILENGFDVTIRAERSQEQSIVEKKLGTLPVLFWKSPKLKLDLKRKPSLEEIENLPWLHFERGPLVSFRQKMDVVVGGVASEIHPRQVRFRTNTLTSIREMILAGLGVGFLPWPLAEAEVARSGLVPLLPGYLSRPDVSFYAVYPSRAYLAPKVRVFLDWFSGKFPQPDPKKFQRAGR
jgi:DNA-binding transcriptional LysR family regulator